jgi:hypothetical protein
VKSSGIVRSGSKLDMVSIAINNLVYSLVWHEASMVEIRTEAIHLNGYSQNRGFF